MIFPEMFKTFSLFFTLCALLSCSNYKYLAPNEPVSSKSIPPSTILNSSDANVLHAKPLVPTSPAVDFSTKSRFQPIPWNTLPGFDETSTSILWSALLDNCEKPHPIWTSSCSQMRPLSFADDQEQRIWILLSLIHI